MLFEQLQDTCVKREWLAGVNGFNFVFNLLYYGASKPQFRIQPINAVPLQPRKF